jgi:hypothetical protein
MVIENTDAQQPKLIFHSLPRTPAANEHNPGQAKATGFSNGWRFIG